MVLEGSDIAAKSAERVITEDALHVLSMDLLRV